MTDLTRHTADPVAITVRAFADVEFAVFADLVDDDRQWSAGRTVIGARWTGAHIRCCPWGVALRDQFPDIDVPANPLAAQVVSVFATAGVSMIADVADVRAFITGWDMGWITPDHLAEAFAIRDAAADGDIGAANVAVWIDYR